MSRSKKILLIVISVFSALLCLLCCLYIYQFFNGSQVHEDVSQAAHAGVSAEEPSQPSDTEEIPTTIIQDPTEDADAAPYIDFDALAEINEEIYAWLEIPGTGISYAILQSATDDLYYNTHGVDKSYYSGGSIYTQRYNSKDFSDPMTLVYGHNFHDESLFAPLLNFIDADFFRDNRCIYIYTPDTVYTYEIFAAYPHTSEHLLLCYDFGDEAQFQRYFDSLSDSVINANYDRDLFPAFGDKVLTLSTCYRLSLGQRYLVQAKLIDTQPYLQED